MSSKPLTRRDFLARASAVAVGVGLSTSLFADVESDGTAKVLEGKYDLYPFKSNTSIRLGKEDLGLVFETDNNPWVALQRIRFETGAERIKAQLRYIPLQPTKEAPLLGVTLFDRDNRLLTKSTIRCEPFSEPQIVLGDPLLPLLTAHFVFEGAVAMKPARFSVFAMKGEQSK